mgnify:CR=1 FL=1
MDYGNYIGDRNPFQLPAPPAWWLQMLYDYDAQLVAIPSRQESIYRLARRTWNRPGIQLMADIHREKDTAMLASYGLVPVTTIVGWGIWGTNIFNSLRARDIWAHGGAEKFVKLEEDAEAEAEQKRKAAIRDDMWMRSGAAWQSYKQRTRQSVFKNGDNPYGGAGSQQARMERRNQTAPQTSRSTAGSGLVLATS